MSFYNHVPHFSVLATWKLKVCEARGITKGWNDGADTRSVLSKITYLKGNIATIYASRAPDRKLIESAVGKEWAVAGGLNQLESTTKLPVVLTRGASTKMAISTIVDFNLFQLEKWLNKLRLIPGWNNLLSSLVDLWLKQAWYICDGWFNYGCFNTGCE